MKKLEKLFGENKPKKKNSQEKVTKKKNYFYEQSGIADIKSNITYKEIVQMTDSQFDDWIVQLRKEIIDRWDNNDTPPLTGKNEQSIISNWKKLENFPIEDFFIEDPESLGVIRNFTKAASSINQFFPTMYKTRISTNITGIGAKSIYDYFADPDLKDDFAKVMNRSVRRDSMYSYSKSLMTDDWSGTGSDFIKQFDDKEGGFWISQNKPAVDTTGCVIMTAKDIKKLLEAGYLKRKHLRNIKDDIKDTYVLKNGKVHKYTYLIRLYNNTQKIFPRATQVFRLGFCQPAVNFPPLTAKFLYERFTSHIKGAVNIYDTSSGWGGRILGAMCTRKKVNYIGTDPNTDNYIPALKKTRYEYVAGYYNKKIKNTGLLGDTANTCEVFRVGSEHIHKEKNFQKYKGKLDLVFSSPPYFNREQYSEDPTQSYKAYNTYDDWRDNFLKPTLTTAYNYLKHDRYILWNVADIKINNTYLPIQKDSIGFLKDLGGEYKGEMRMLMTKMMGINLETKKIRNSVKIDGKIYKYEPIIVVYKK